MTLQAPGTHLSELKRALEGENVPVLLLDWNLKIVAATVAAEKILQGQATGESRDELLCGIRQVCDSAREEWHRILLNAERPGRQLVIRAELTGDLAVQIVTQAPGDRELGRPTFRSVFLPSLRDFPEARLGWLALLGSAELEVTLLVCRGFTNQAVADRLSRSVPTVKAQLSTVYRKLEVANRAELISTFSPVTQTPEPLRR